MTLEILFGGLITAALAYLINEINQIQEDLKKVLIEVAVLKACAPKRKTDQT